MSGLEFAFGIVLVMTIATVYLASVALTRGKRATAAQPDGLRDEVEALRQRIGVLERIAVEKEHSLEREFELLRDR